MKRILAALLSFGLLLTTLVGCSQQGSQPLRIDFGSGVNSLDPQFVTDTAGRTILANTMEGLLGKDESGKIIPAAAERYELSPDGLRYTFYLRRDGRWSDGEPVVAGDFVFALQRIFHKEVPSPYAEDFLSIRNAPLVLSGELPQSLLGVKAKDDYTLEITLSQPSPLFPEKLTTAAALPCNEEFFTATRARYGLGTSYLKFNGAYEVTAWNNDKYILLEPNPHYHTQKELPFPTVYLYTNRITPQKSALDLLNEGKSDVYLATAEELPAITAKEVTYREIKNRVWQLLFNTEYETLGNEQVRRGLALALDSGGYTQRIPPMYGLADSLIPQSARPEGLPRPKLLPYSREAAREAVAQGLAETQQEKLPQLKILVPAGAQLDAVAGYLQKQLLDTHNVVVNFEAVEQKEFDRRLQNKEFSLVLVSQEASGQDCADVLSNYATGGIGNYGGFSNLEFDGLLDSGIRADSQRQSLEYYQQAEQLLIDRAAAVPLFTQSGYYVFSKGTTGVSLVGGLLRFQDAQRKG